MINPKSPIVAVVGAGKIGTDLVSNFADGNNKIIWFIRSDGEKIIARWKKRLSRKVKNGLVSNNQFQNIIENLSFTDQMSDLSSADILMEALSENLTVKNNFLNNAHQYLGKNAIITSASSSFTPRQFDVYESRSANFAGTHVFHPMHYFNHLELITTDKTSLNTINFVNRLYNEIGFNIIHQKGMSCFSVNRYFLDLQSHLFNYCKQHQIPINSVDEILIDQHVISIPLMSMIEHVGKDILITSIKNYLTLDPQKQELYRPLLTFLEINSNSTDTLFSSASFNNDNPITNEAENNLVSYFKKISVISLTEYKKINIESARQFLIAVKDILGIEG